MIFTEQTVEDRHEQQLMVELEALKPRVFQNYRTAQQQQALYEEWLKKEVRVYKFLKANPWKIES